jgi:hypothetical protein
MENKPWYLSKTIWTGLVTVIFAVLSGTGALPEGLTEGYVNEVIGGILGVLTILFRTHAGGIGTPAE